MPNGTSDNVKVWLQGLCETIENLSWIDEFALAELVNTPASVEVRGRWYPVGTYGVANQPPAEFRILINGQNLALYGDIIPSKGCKNLRLSNSSCGVLVEFPVTNSEKEALTMFANLIIQPRYL